MTAALRQAAPANAVPGAASAAPSAALSLAQSSRSFRDTSSYDINRIRGNSAGLAAILTLAAAVCEKHANRLQSREPEWTELMDQRNALHAAQHLVDGLFYTAECIENDIDCFCTELHSVQGGSDHG